MTLDVFQQVFLLSLASNSVNKEKGTQTTLQQSLQAHLTEDLPEIDSQWQVVWGPVVWKLFPNDASSGPENSWYIAFHPQLEFEDGSVHATYVIAIAGTPRDSLYAWFGEDFRVGTVSDFGTWVAGGIQNSPVQSTSIVQGDAYIATGTVNTVHLLLTTSAPQGAASEGTTLLDFVTKHGSTRFITTGHSLGGALSPSLALSLVQSGVIGADDTLTYPTAGASPGNVEFTELFTRTLPPRKQSGAASYQGWNLNLVNTFDIVPQAWAAYPEVSPKQNLNNIPTLYGTPALITVWLTIGLAIVWSKSSGVQYIPLPSQYFTGGAPPPPTPTSLSTFIKVASQQHVEEYIKDVGVVIPSLAEPRILFAGITLKSEEENRFNYPLIIDLEWARQNPEKAKLIEYKVEGNPAAAVYLGGVKEGVSLAVADA